MRLLRRPAMAECRKVARQLQIYLDGEIDAATAEKIESHLDVCRRCGLAADTYREIKAALARRAQSVDPAAIERLTEFTERLGSGDVNLESDH